MKNKNSGFKALLAILIYFSLLYLLSVVECRNEGSNIKCFSDALWYSLVTLTTVGYGDFYPVTPIGKFLALMFIIGSLGILGFIIGRATEFISEVRWKRKMGYYGTSFEKHVVILGWDNFAHSIVKDLVQAGQKIAIITDEKNDIDLIYTEFSDDNVFCLFADLKNVSMFENAGIGKAAMVFINLKDDTEKLISILNIRKEYPQSKFIVALDNSDLSNTFYSAGTAFVLSKNEIASKLMASYIFEPDVADMTNDLLTISQNNEEYDIKEFKIIKENPFAGKTYGEIFTELKKKLNVLAIGLCKEEKEGKRKIIKLPGDDLKVEAGDYLIVIMSGKEIAQVKELFRTCEGVVY
jgi:voltage-gated potassium channel